METDKTVLVFRLKYTNAGGWGAISNFITKYIEGAAMDLGDVSIASSRPMERQDDNFQLAKAVDRDQELFKPINKPENIYAVKKKYEVVFFICVPYEQLQDVVDLQNLYLICEANSRSRVVAMICGKESEYHKTSQFLYILTSDNSIRESIFFKSNQIKHLQRDGIGTLSRFLPLIPVNASTESLLRQKMYESVSLNKSLSLNERKEISSEIIKRTLGGVYEEKKIPKILAGAFKKLSQHHQKLEKCDIEQCAQMIGEVDVLPFLLFCFLLEGYQNGFTDSRDFYKELQKIVYWAGGCNQLVENIVFHSGRGTGAFSFRILEGERAYIKEKYALGDDRARWLELMVTDYPGCSHTCNIAENFLERLTDIEMKSQFRKLCPRDFFVDNEDEEIGKAWDQYYLEKENVVNHYGLKIFRNVVQNNNGYFIVQSHSTHVPKKGEYYYGNSQQEIGTQQVCMPGTSYSILLPIMRESAKEEEYTDYGIEDYNDKLCAEDLLFDYEVIYESIVLDGNILSSGEKAAFINQLSEKMVDSEEKRRIICIDASAFRANKAEILCKSIVMAMLRCDKPFHVVMYGCCEEFVRMFLDVSYVSYVSHMRRRNLKGEWRHGGQRQIALYMEDYREILILPGDWNETLRINKSSNFSRETKLKDYFEKYPLNGSMESAEKRRVKYPFDIMIGETENDTFFEKYVEMVANRSVQKQELGCKIENVHMRLGSTIHVNHFYEAEVLFGNSFFVERFALLMIKRMYKPLQKGVRPIRETDKITLYGYANYSEQTVFCTMQFLLKIYPKMDVDYAILESNSEDRGFTHVDRLRYSTYYEEGEKGAEKRKQHFQGRKIVCIIPIASTLKTNEKMINLFTEENGTEGGLEFWRNFELILVSTTEETNPYWKKDGKIIRSQKGKGIDLSAEFFAEVSLTYKEPLDCELCFPTEMIDEQPLVEVNAASTIPNQAFGLMGEETEMEEIGREQLLQEERSMLSLKDILLYRHLERNENHFLFYFQTELLAVQRPDEIREWLKNVRLEMQKKQLFSNSDYIILFCPAHFSNAVFVEFVNSYIFGGAAVVLRDDVDKEYRCNFRAKYSNLRMLVEKAARSRSGKADGERQIRLFYVDDMIVTGHTFQRAKSLAQSLLEDYAISERQKYAVFDGIFVLIDRNSKSSRWQYTGVKEEERLYAFRTVHISSIRNHGDACVYCNLAKEAETLKRSSVTRRMTEYWKAEEEKFTVKPLVQYFKDKNDQVEALTGERLNTANRAYRRLVCTNNAMVFLKERYHNNYKVNVLEQLLTLILEGSILHEGEEAEYFLSYCKVLSRPFRVFDKAIKEAVFDFLLVACMCALSQKTYSEVIDSSKEKKYLQDEKIKDKFLEIEKFVSRYFEERNRQQDLIKVLLKQLTEMKSNFVLRKENMELVLAYADRIDTAGEKVDFVRYYECLLKKLTGVSSDTSKSLWLDKMMKEHWGDFGGKSVNRNSEGGEEWKILEEIYLENVWIYQDAFQKLGKRVKLTSWQDPLRQEDEERTEGERNQSEKEDNNKKDIIKEELAQFGEKWLQKYITHYQFKDFIELLSLYGFGDKDGKLYEEGRIFAASNFLLNRFISDEFEKGVKKVGARDKGNLTRIDYIAACMKYIMDVTKIVIMMEFDAEYDVWENKLIGGYNALASVKGDVAKLPQEPKKEYLVLGSSDGKSAGWTFRKKEVIELVQKFRNRENLAAERGYIYDLEGGRFLWELGHATEYPVYILAEWENSKQDIDRLNRIRCVLQYYWLLDSYVFNKSNEGFFYELARQRKKAAIHNRQKAYSHTKHDIKLVQNNHMLAKGRYEGYFQSDLLMLLTDLNVSEHYRNSLTMEYYLNRVGFRAGQWDSEFSPFRKDKERKFYVINPEIDEPTELIISYEVLFEGDVPLRDNEQVIALDCANAERETFLLIYSLMLNATTDGRGHMENGSVTAYCSKTQEGHLRIANQVGDNSEQKEVEKIMNELRYPPEEENQGISLWSMSRYIKRVIASALNNKLKNLEKKVGTISTEELEQFGEQILRMLGKDFQIAVKRDKIEGKDYFSVLVPVLAEKYGEL